MRSAFHEGGGFGGRSPPLIGPGNRPEPDADAQAFFARMAVPPSGDHRAAWTRRIRRLKRAGLWADLVIDCRFVAATAQAALLNVKGPLGDAVPVGPVDFVAARAPGADPATVVAAGFRGGAAPPAYLSHGASYADLTAATGLSLTDMTNLVHVLDDVVSDGYDAGTTAGNDNGICTRTSVGSLAVYASGGFDAAGVTTSIGLSGYARSGSSLAILRDGAVLDTIGGQATAPSSGTITTCQTANANYSPRRIVGRTVATRAWDAPRQSVFYAIDRAFLIELGATRIPPDEAAAILLLLGLL